MVNVRCKIKPSCPISSFIPLLIGVNARLHFRIVLCSRALSDLVLNVTGDMVFTTSSGRLFHKTIELTTSNTVSIQENLLSGTLIDSILSCYIQFEWQGLLLTKNITQCFVCIFSCTLSDLGAYAQFTSLFLWWEKHKKKKLIVPVVVHGTTHKNITVVQHGSRHNSAQIQCCPHLWFHHESDDIS